MAEWNLSFDYAAVFGYLIIFIWMFNQKGVPMRSYRVFRMFLVTAFMAVVLEIISTQFAREVDLVGYTLFYNVLSLQTLCINLTPIFFAYYVILLTHLDSRAKFFNLIYWGAALIDTVIIAFNPFLRWAVSFENGKYRIGPVGVIMYLIDLAMIVISAVVIIRYRKNFLFIKLIPLTFIFICGVVACVGQIVFYVPLLNLMLMTVALTLYHYQQNSGMITDSVTGVFNRKFMGEYIRNLFYDKKTFGVILLAMDDFKFINKTYGVEGGDYLLRQVGLYLEGLKVSKVVFRFGSDQFCIVLHKNVETLNELAGQIQERFRAFWRSINGVDVMMSASACCMECPRDAASYGELVEVLDYSLGEAKRIKRGKITDISEIDIDKVKMEKSIEKAVRHAIDTDGLLVYYQPIYSAQKEGYHSAEALVRLQDEELGWISPDDFIPIAEKNGMIVEMGEMILEKVCKFIHDNCLEQTTIEFIEVNLSPLQLLQVQFATRVRQIMKQYEVKPTQINFEITETAAVNSMPSIMDNIDKLMEYGISFSLDDYGSGYSNINYINRMAFNIVKIDKEMLWESFKNEKAAVTLEYSIAMMNALKLSIVAEGVETEEMRDKLVEYGCHYLQGWLFSKAVPGAEFMELIQAAGK